MINALTIDVEEYFHVHAFDGVIPRDSWEERPRRVVESTRRFLRLCQRHHTKATFFILGWVADREPALIREIADEGHEIASHGYWHRAVSQQTEAEFEEDIRQSLEAIQRAAPGTQVAGYRAPSFSITPDQDWAFDVLARQGFTYDSSLFPIKMHDKYGYPSAPRTAHRRPGGFFEVPMSTVRVGGQNWPVGGGGYLRIFPLGITQWAIRRLNREGIPAVVYLHPWELDPDQPRVPGAPLKSRLRHYTNLGKMEDRLGKMLETFEFTSMSEVFVEPLANHCGGSMRSGIS